MTANAAKLSHAESTNQLAPYPRASWPTSPHSIDSASHMSLFSLLFRPRKKNPTEVVAALSEALQRISNCSTSDVRLRQRAMEDCSKQLAIMKELLRIDAPSCMFYL